MAGTPSVCLRCGGPVHGEHPSRGRGICLPCANTSPVSREVVDTQVEVPRPPFPRVFHLPKAGEEIDGLLVERELGAGGMGSVLVARDGKLDREVAVKFLRDGSMRNEKFQRMFHTEGKALARINHPNVVRVFSLGSWEDWPYIVMERVDGRPLSDEIAGGVLPVEEAVRIGRELASALAAVHAENIAHRDVTPRNCLLRHADRSACLIDFGLARDYTRRTATSGQVAGTPHYIAPERLRGRPSDVRVDIYAFGVLLFEMLTGRVPFEGLDSGAYLRAVLHDDPPLLRTLRPEAPRGLEVLVARALSRAAEFRYDDGAVLLRALEDMERGAADLSGATRVAEPVPTLDATEDPAEDLPLLGRAEAFRATQACLDRVVEGRGQVLLVEGLPGAGKSRFLREIARLSGPRAVQVVRCRGREFGSEPFAALRAMMLEHAAALGDRTPDDLIDRVAAAAPGNRVLLPALRWILEPGSWSEGPSHSRTSLRKAALAALRALVRVRPAVVVVDDAYLLDAATWDILAAAADQCEAWPLGLAFSFRITRRSGENVETDARYPFLAGLAHATGIPLPPLETTDVGRLIGHALDCDEAQAVKLAPVLHAKSGGNPLYLVESLRMLADEGRLDVASEGSPLVERISQLSIPPLLLDVARRRLGSLDETEREIVQVCSIDRRGVPSSVVMRCEGLDEMSALRALQRLVSSRRILREEEGLYSVVHEALRDAAHDELLPELRKACHGEMAAWLEESGEATRDPGRLGRHLSMAGRGVEAVPHLVSAGQRLLHAFQPALALQRFDDSIVAAGGTPNEEGVLGRASALERLGRMDEARIDLVMLCATGSVRAMLQRVDFERNRGAYGEASLLLGYVDAARCEGDAAVDRLVLRAQLASTVGNGEVAKASLDEAEAASSEPGVSMPCLLRFRTTKGTVLWRLGMFNEARAEYERTLQLSEAAGEPDRIAVMAHNLSLVCVDLGRTAEAMEWAERAVEQASLLGSERTLVYARLQLADILIRELRFADAGNELQAVTDDVERLDSDEARFQLAARRCEWALGQGDPVASLEQVAAGLALTVDLPTHAAGFHGYAASAHLLSGSHDEALASARTARSMFAAAGAAEFEEESLALAARAARLSGADEPECAELRELDEALTVTGAVEAALATKDENRRRAFAARAMELAGDPWDRSEVHRHLGAVAPPSG